MPDYSKLLRRARDDVHLCIGIWSDLLGSLYGENLVCAYSKGSGVKPWDGEIDYVPLISDVDIHVHLKPEVPITTDDVSSFELAMKASAEYEERFLGASPEHLHIPRTQITFIRMLEDDISYVAPRASDVRMLIGRFKDTKPFSAERIREIDYEQLLSMKPFLEDIPRTLIDRTGLDLWNLLRRLTWRVSPAPVRLITQKHEDPYEVWTWNRTRILSELEAMDYDAIAQNYKDFYDAGWRLFLSDFSDSGLYREMIEHGYHLLWGCVREAQEVTD